MNEWDLRSFDWPLLPRSVIWEIGGYEGRWAREILTRYSCQMYVFEPQIWAYERLTVALAGFSTARTFDFGLGDVDAELPMGDYLTDGASFLKDSPDSNGIGRLREIAAIKRKLKVGRINLMMVNIEGYEYTLIPHMLRSRILPDYLVYQGHEFAGRHDAALREQLARRYVPLWDYGLTLSAWRRRSKAAPNKA